MTNSKNNWETENSHLQDILMLLPFFFFCCLNDPCATNNSNGSQLQSCAVCFRQQHEHEVFDVFCSILSIQSINNISKRERERDKDKHSLNWCIILSKKGSAKFDHNSNVVQNKNKISEPTPNSWPFVRRNLLFVESLLIFFLFFAVAVACILHSSQYRIWSHNENARMVHNVHEARRSLLFMFCSFCQPNHNRKRVMHENHRPNAKIKWVCCLCIKKKNK